MKVKVRMPMSTSFKGVDMGIRTFTFIFFMTVQVACIPRAVCNFPPPSRQPRYAPPPLCFALLSFDRVQFPIVTRLQVTQGVKPKPHAVGLLYKTKYLPLSYLILPTQLILLVQRGTNRSLVSFCLQKGHLLKQVKCFYTEGIYLVEGGASLC
jgi:hypothetical protein